MSLITTSRSRTALNITQYEAPKKVLMNKNINNEEYIIANVACFMIWDFGFICNNSEICIISAVGVGLVLSCTLFNYLKNSKKINNEQRIIAIKNLIHQTLYSACLITMCIYYLL